MANVLKEYLIKLGFKLDDGSYKKFRKALTETYSEITELGTEAVAVATALEYAIQKVADQQEALQFVSARTGASVSHLQAYRFAATQIGLSAEQATASVENFASSLRLNPGLQGLARAFGVTEQKDALKQQQQLVEGMKARNVPYFMAQRFASMFGMDDHTLFQFWQFAPEMKEWQEGYTKRLREAGVTADENAPKFRKYMDDTRLLGSNFDIAGQRIAQDFLPYAHAATLKLNDLVESFNKANKASHGFYGEVLSLGTTIAGSAGAFALIARILGFKGVTGGLFKRLLSPSMLAIEGIAAIKADAETGNHLRNAIRHALADLFPGLRSTFGDPADDAEPAPWKEGGVWHPRWSPGAGQGTWTPGSNFRPTGPRRTGAPWAPGDLGNTQRMDAELVDRLRRMAEAMPAEYGGVKVNSGFRTREEQAELFNRYGPGRAARPGHSPHEEGKAGDLMWETERGKAWSHAHAGEFGLSFPVPGEAWHVEASRIKPDGSPTSIRIQNTNTFHITGPDPVTTADRVFDKQKQLDADLMRNTLPRHQ